MPIGLLLVAVVTLREGRLLRWARLLPLLATCLFVGMAIAVAIVPEAKLEGQVAAILLALASVTWSGYVSGMGGSLGPGSRL